MNNTEQWTPEQKACPCGLQAKLIGFNEFNAKYKCDCGNEFNINLFVKVVSGPQKGE